MTCASAPKDHSEPARWDVLTSETIGAVENLIAKKYSPSVKAKYMIGSLCSVHFRIQELLEEHAKEWKVQGRATKRHTDTEIAGNPKYAGGDSRSQNPINQTLSKTQSQPTQTTKSR